MCRIAERLRNLKSRGAYWISGKFGVLFFRLLLPEMHDDVVRCRRELYRCTSCRFGLGEVECFVVLGTQPWMIKGYIRLRFLKNILTKRILTNFKDYIKILWFIIFLCNIFMIILILINLYYKILKI